MQECAQQNCNAAIGSYSIAAHNHAIPSWMQPDGCPLLLRVMADVQGGYQPILFLNSVIWAT